MKITYTCFFLFLFLPACERTNKAEEFGLAIIPKPLNLTPSGGTFLLNGQTQIFVDFSLLDIANDFGKSVKLNLPISHPEDVNIEHQSKKQNSIYIYLSDSTQFIGESYSLRIEENQILLSAKTRQGIFWGLQSLKQIIPHDRNENTPILLPTVAIYDKPLFPWRGAMLDVARHFFSVQEVKRYIDLISAYKINRLHLHLSDDQGWRIEIKSWPKLTSTGAKTQVGGGPGGFFSQAEYKEIVQYAQEKFITIIPEIDMPGHVHAALVSYDELSCAQYDNKEAYTGLEVGFSYLCPDKPVVYQFIQDVIREIATITPGPYIHIGGDEVEHLDVNEYIKFINYIRTTVKATGKTMVGWEDISPANIDEHDIVQHWRSVQHIQAAAEKKAKIILSPASRTYLDMKYNAASRIGYDWAGLINVRDAYDWDPITHIKNLAQMHILGVEAPLWTETAETMDDLEYLAFPRILALAEVAWTPASNRTWENFRRRLAEHGPAMREANIDYYPSKLIPWK